MDNDAKKIALRMIPYGLYVLTAQSADGARVAAATVNWVTQTSFNPPLVVIGIKADSGAYQLVKDTKAFVLNILGSGQGKLAFGFFKPAEKSGNTISGEPFRLGKSGAPILENAPAAVECAVVEIVARGDHHIVVAEVVDAHVAKAPTGRPDEAVLHMKELGLNVFYGG